MSLSSTISDGSVECAAEDTGDLYESAAATALLAPAFGYDERYGPIELLARNQFDDEVSSNSSEGETPCSMTSRMIKNLRQPQLASAPHLPEPSMAEYLSSSGPSFSSGWSLESPLDPNLRSRQRSSAASPSLACYPKLFSRSTDDSLRSNFQIESPHKAVPSPEVTPLSQTLLLPIEDLASKRTSSSADEDYSQATHFAASLMFPDALTDALNRPAEDRRHESFHDDGSRPSSSRMSTNPTNPPTRRTTFSTAPTSICEDAIDHGKHPFPTPNMLYKFHRLNAPTGHAGAPPPRSCSKLHTQSFEPNTDQASEKGDDGPETVFGQLARGLSTGSRRSWRARPRR